MDAAEIAEIEARLKHYSALTHRVLLSFVPQRPPRRYLYDLVPSYPARGGKGLRPGLCIASCRAFDGELGDALHPAATLELFHNAFLVHDDVEDGSEFRRGLPTLSEEFGLPIALNVGDAMNLLSLHPLMACLERLGSQLTWRLFTEIEHMVRESVEGQAMELGWVRDNDIDLAEEDYLRMILKKTCWYTTMHPCRIGALVGTAGSSDPDRFNNFAYFMGAAFQIQDDLLNLVGDEKRYGKEIGGDILEGKRTLILIHLLNHCDDHNRRRLQAFLARPRKHRTMEEVAWVLGLMRAYGSLDHARESAHELAEAAWEEFHAAYRDAADNEDKRLVGQIVTYMVERDI